MSFLVFTHIHIYYIDTDEVPGFLLLSKNHIFTVCSEDTILIFHVCGYLCGHGYQHNYPITTELLAQARGRLIWNFIHKMASRCEESRVIEFFSSLLEFWLFRTENISIIFFISRLKLYIRVSWHFCDQHFAVEEHFFLFRKWINRVVLYVEITSVSI